MVFEIERTDKQSLYRWCLEVNVVMSAVPKLMYWSDQAIGWDRDDCRWISCRKNTGYHAMDPKDSNAGGWTCEILDRNKTR
jgi:hypothetical protein